MKSKIQQFYSNLKFPGLYSKEDLDFYEINGIHNIYLKEINNILHDGLTVLDVGCGTGLLSNLFANKYKNCKITSIDFSDSIDYAQKFADDNNINNITFIKEDFILYNSDEQYDVVICHGVLHHIPEHYDALVKLKKLVKPGGTLILAVYNTFGKILKHFSNIEYNSEILYVDQEQNPFELSFTHNEVLKLCNDLTFVKVEPSFKNKFVNLHALFNSENGGLALYVFKK
jgi:2-polyprenyl-3-methyl-5-hydroxy-6-metoxy-1,4-benzoquinol methylase